MGEAVELVVDICVGYGLRGVGVGVEQGAHHVAYVAVVEVVAGGVEVAGGGAGFEAVGLAPLFSGVYGAIVVGEVTERHAVGIVGEVLVWVGEIAIVITILAYIAERI